jgi:hypothetical protein
MRATSLFFFIDDFDDTVSTEPRIRTFFKKKKSHLETSGRHGLFIELSRRQPSEEGIVRISTSQPINP